MSYHSHRVLLLYFQQLASLSDEPNSDQSVPSFSPLILGQHISSVCMPLTKKFLTIRMDSFTHSYVTISTLLHFK